ncbi:MAG: PD40 domain-containing protein [Flavobacteriales bacterium]|nr:PD40 domain-containing protein [Flavobacteriales bacterium]
MRILLPFILFLFIGIKLFGQLDPRLAYDLFKNTNYLDARLEFKKHLKVDPKDAKALFHLGLCYLNTNIDKSAAIDYLERCQATGNADKECLFYLGMAYTHVYDYDKAIETLKEYLKSPGKFSVEANLLIEQYSKAKELYDNPLDVTFENLGDGINSTYPDYGPFCSKDEKFIVFTTRRDGGKGMKEFDGYFPSDIMITKYDGFNFMKGKFVGINTAYDESVVGIADDGSNILLYFDNITEAGEIYISEESGGSYSKKKKIPEGVNDPKTIETSASISEDQQTLFFASNRDGGKGGLDLYMTRKLPNGKWADPQNIDYLNTPGHEDYPMLSSDGSTLYFCSNGHGGLGGYDIFKSTWDSEKNKWSDPVNIGYPLNTSYDDKVISFTADGNHAYVAQVRPDGVGDMDIYKVTINKEKLNPAIYLVELKDATTNSTIGESMIYVYNDKDELVGEFKQFNDKPIAITLDPGKYSLEIEAPGYELKVQSLKVSDFDISKGIVNLTYKLAK